MWKILSLIGLCVLSLQVQAQEPCMQQAEIRSISSKRSIEARHDSIKEVEVVVGYRAADEDYPAFERVKITNYADTSVSIPLQGRSVMFIREAEINPGEWLPVEYWSDDWCWCGYTGKSVMELKPLERIHFITYRMSGKEKVRMRYKIKLGDKGAMFYSEPFPGRINMCQLVVPEQDTSFWPVSIHFLDKN